MTTRGGRGRNRPAASHRDSGIGLVERVRSDVRYAHVAARAGRLLLWLRARGLTTLADVVAYQATRAPDQEAVRFGRQSLSYATLDARANRYAHWAHAAGIRRGDVVAVLMHNDPEFLAAWLGLAKIGAVSALLNTNLVERPLAHSLDVVKPGHVIVGAGLEDAYASARAHRTGKAVAWYRHDPPRGGRALADALADADTTPPDAAWARRAGDDRLCYIYTSGTTGLPKAAIISHLRAVGAAIGGTAALDITPRDRSYVVLPLYHASGSILAAGGAFVGGATVILAPKFSASRFWSDCVAHKATLFQYIGELCRFLVNQPPSPAERRHTIRACMGNGLRADVWEEMQRRFRIPQIVEFYGATEGNVGLVNLDNRVGAIGRVPPALHRLVGIRLLKYDVERDELYRDRKGRYVEAAIGEPGEAIGRIGLTGGFDGYSDRKASAAKVLRNVFLPGDSYFRTGDLLRYDADGYYYFVDRIGDTFRWRGENVSTGEVAEIVARYPGMQDVCVYGVEVPGLEGRAGMAAVMCDDDIDGAALGRHVTANLPAYARPLFVRRLSAIATTGTFKHQKLVLAREGFDPEVVSDPLYVLDQHSGTYRALDRRTYDDICRGKWRL